MKKLYVYADFDWLKEVELIGELGYESLRGADSYSFTFNNEWLRQHSDPEKDDDAAEEAAAVAAFAQNPDDISMEFPGENQVCLHVSDAYQAYAAEMGYTAYLDFFWMKNAFLIDYLADMIRGEGYQLGIISSKDGFVRCLDETGKKEYQYSCTIFPGMKFSHMER